MAVLQRWLTFINFILFREYLFFFLVNKVSAMGLSLYAEVAKCFVNFANQFMALSH